LGHGNIIGPLFSSFSLDGPIDGHIMEREMERFIDKTDPNVGRERKCKSFSEKAGDPSGGGGDLVCP